MEELSLVARMVASAAIALLVFILLSVGYLVSRLLGDAFLPIVLISIGAGIVLFLLDALARRMAS